MLNIDGALKFLALEIALVNSDGYWTRASDYNIYLDERAGSTCSRTTSTKRWWTRVAVAAAAAGVAAAPARRPDFNCLPVSRLRQASRRLPPGGFPATFGQAGADFDPLIGLDDTSKPLRSRLLAVPALRERYLGYVREIAEKWLDWRTLEPLVTQYQSVIADAVKVDTRKLYTTDAFTADVATSDASIKRFVDARRAFLLKDRR